MSVLSVTFSYQTNLHISQNNFISTTLWDCHIFIAFNFWAGSALPIIIINHIYKIPNHSNKVKFQELISKHLRMISVPSRHASIELFNNIIPYKLVLKSVPLSLNSRFYLVLDRQARSSIVYFFFYISFLSHTPALSSTSFARLHRRQIRRLYQGTCLRWNSLNAKPLILIRKFN